MNNSFLTTSKDISSNTGKITSARESMKPRTSLRGVLIIALISIFATGCNTNNSTDKTMRAAQADSVAQSTGQEGEHGEGDMMGNDNQQRDNDNRSRDSMGTGKKHRGMGAKHRGGMMNK